MTRIRSEENCRADMKKPHQLTGWFCNYSARLLLDLNEKRFSAGLGNPTQPVFLLDLDEKRFSAGLGNPVKPVVEYLQR